METAGQGRRRRRRGLWAVIVLPLAAFFAVAAGLALSHFPVPLPGWVLAQAEARANAALSGRMQVAVSGGADLIIDEGLVPRIRVRRVRLARPSGAPIAVLPEMWVSFWPEPLLHGRMVPQALRITEAKVALRRLADGRIDLDLGGAGAMEGVDFRNFGQIDEAVEAAFDTPALRALERITVDDVRIRIDDARLNRVWEVSDGDFRLTQSGSEIALALGMDIGERNEKPARVTFEAAISKQGPEARFEAKVTDAPSRDLAVQSPAVAMLGVIDAPISGSFRTGIDAGGAMRSTQATLSVGAGAISPVEGAPPVPFDGGRMMIDYDPQARKVTFGEASFSSKALRFRAKGLAYLRDFDGGLPRTALVQVQMSDIEADPEGVFAAPARFSFGAVDGRLRLDPFRVDIGQLQLVEADRRISGKGRISAAADGWRVALDAGIDQIEQHDLLALWPPKLVPHTRDWLAQNVVTGELRNAHASVRLAPDAAPRFELGYEFRGAGVSVLRTLPPIREGRGFATIHDDSHTLMVEEGFVDAPSGGRVEVADLVMAVPDIREKPARAEVALVTRSPIPAALSLLDEEPFRFLSKAGKGTDLAGGWAEARTNLRFAMEKKVDPKDVDFDVTARLTEVTSDKVVPGKALSAPVLVLRADRAGMTISGKGQFESVPFDARWSQRFGDENKGKSSLDGYVNVTPEALAGVGIALPKGMLAGSGWGRLRLALVQGQPTAYDFETDLKGIALSVPEIDWSKPAAPKGRLALSGLLTQPPTVETFALSAPGIQPRRAAPAFRAGDGARGIRQARDRIMVRRRGHTRRARQGAGAGRRDPQGHA